MQWRNFALGTVFLLAPSLAMAIGDLSFPADPCVSAWGQLKSQEYLFEHLKDKDYSSYLERLRSTNLDRKQCHKTWTVLIYMSTTKDLAPYAIADLLEMENRSAGSSLRADVIVQLNNGINSKSRRLHMFQRTDPIQKLLGKKDLKLLSEDQITSPQVLSFDQNPMISDSQKFEDFLRWGIEEYPSEHYLVVIWGHGQTWNGLTPASENSVGAQDSAKDLPLLRYGTSATLNTKEDLNLPSIRKVLKSIKKWRGDPIEVFASDTCLMQSTEDATELSKDTQYICGSEDIESYAGFPYQSLLSELNTGEFAGAPRLASNVERAYGEPYLVAWMIPYLYRESFDPVHGSQRELDPRGFDELTGSSVATKHLRATLVPALNKLGEALLGYFQENRERWIDLKSAIKKGPYFRGGTQDLGDFLKRLDRTVTADADLNGGKLSPAAATAKRAINQTYRALNYSVVNSVLGDKYPKFNPSKEYGPRGLSIWLPKNYEDYKERIGNFLQSKFLKSDSPTQASGWARWLELMYPDPEIEALYFH